MGKEAIQGSLEDHATSRRIKLASQTARSRDRERKGWLVSNCPELPILQQSLIFTCSWPAMYRSVMEANNPDPDCNSPDYDISNITSNLESPPIISPSNLPGYGSRKENAHPFVPKGLTQEQRNADHLMEFFASWSLAHCDKFRRFIIVTHLKPEPRWLSWQHIELYHGPKEFMRVFKVDHGNYLTKLRQGDQPTPTASTSDPSQDPRIQETRTFTSFNPPNPGTPAAVDIPWRGLSQIRTVDSRPSGDTSTNPPRGPYSPRDTFSPREAYSPRDPSTNPPRGPYSPRDLFSPREAYSPRDPSTNPPRGPYSPRDPPRGPRSNRPYGGPQAQGADCYRPKDGRRSRESSPRRDYRPSKESSPRRDPRLPRDAPAQRGSKSRGDSYYPYPYR